MPLDGEQDVLVTCAESGIKADELLSGQTSVWFWGAAGRGDARSGYRVGIAYHVPGKIGRGGRFRLCFPLTVRRSVRHGLFLLPIAASSHSGDVSPLSPNSLR